ncbi:MAG TPA: UPF0147 family protein [Thermoplasmata archaeon]|nr:UPF0147 family protein [Thermoplasmata archaeon]
MTVPSSLAPSAGAAAAAPRSLESATPAFQHLVESLAELADDSTVPRNIRRGAQSAKDELAKPRVPLDLRIASAVYLLDELANDTNLPTHGRTAIWSIISGLESLQ